MRQATFLDVLKIGAALVLVLGVLELALAQSAPENKVAVKFYGTNSAGLPQFWPHIVQPGTNAPAGFVLLAQAQLDTIIATNRPAYLAWESNQTAQAQAKLDASLQDFLAKMDKIDLWIERTSGTNTLSNNQRDAAINDLAQTFRKLKPILRKLVEQETQ